MLQGRLGNKEEGRIPAAARKSVRWRKISGKLKTSCASSSHCSGGTPGQVRGPCPWCQEMSRPSLREAHRSDALTLTMNQILWYVFYLILMKILWRKLHLTAKETNLEITRNGLRHVTGEKQSWGNSGSEPLVCPGTTPLLQWLPASLTWGATLGALLAFTGCLSLHTQTITPSYPFQPSFGTPWSHSLWASYSACNIGLPAFQFSAPAPVSSIHQQQMVLQHV